MRLAKKMRLGTKLFAAGTLVVTGVIGFFTFVENVSVGTVGVVYDLGKVQDTTLSQGWHIVGLTDRVVEYPVRTQNVTYKDMNVSTVDGKNLTLGASISYHVDPESAPQVYKKYGSVDIQDLQEGAIKNRIYDAIRQTISKYTVLQTFGDKTSEIKHDAFEIARKDLAKYGFILEDIVIGTPAVDEATAKAINERVKSTQELERSKTDLEIAKARAEKSRVEAQAEADANKIVSESLSENVIKQHLIDKWDGKSPITIGGESIVNLK